MQRAKDAVGQFDMFAATPTLRARGSSSVVNTCTGFFSMLMFGFFTYVLIDLIVSIANEEKIQASERIVTNPRSNRTATISKFALTPGDELPMELEFQMSDNTTHTFHIFNISAVKLRREKGKKEQIPVQKYLIENCTLKQIQEFRAINQNDYPLYCLQEDQPITLDNDPQTGFSERLEINFDYIQCRSVNLLFRKQCEISIQQQCKEELLPKNICQQPVAYCIQFAKEMQDDCEKNIEDTSTKLDSIVFATIHVFMQNVAFDPTAPEPTIELFSQIKTTITTLSSSFLAVELDHYQIETDQSVLPWESTSISSGWMLGKQQQTPYQFASNYHLVQFSFKHSTSTKVITRKIGKLDQALSYVGGLFGIVVGFFAFFLMSYNEYKYELQISQQAFNYKSDGKKIKSKEFSFWQYVKYSFYDWSNALLCCELGSEGTSKKIHETRGEINEQLNVTYLFRRLQYYERVFEYLLTYEQRVALYLTQPPSLDDVAKTRKISQYYEKIVDGEKALTLEDFEKIEEEQSPTNVFAVPQQKLVIDYGKKNKNGFPKDPVLRSRRDILEMALNTFPEQLHSEIQIEGQESLIQQEIATAFFSLSSYQKSKIQEKIPLKILNKLKKVHENQLKLQIQDNPQSLQRFLNGKDQQNKR